MFLYVAQYGCKKKKNLPDIRHLGILLPTFIVTLQKQPYDDNAYFT